MNRKIYVVEQHDQVLGLWHQLGLKELKVLHVDFHCDMRGLLIHRKNQVAYRIWDRHPTLDEGNYLKHGVIDGTVSQVRWVHDQPGGRMHDYYSVKYETDLSAGVHRAAITLRKQRGFKINYDVIETKAWRGTEPGEVLDIDWDYFACTEYPVDSIPPRVKAFWERDFTHVPDHTFVCYSPGHSHPTRTMFRKFIEQLSSRFDAETIDVPLDDNRSARRGLRNMPVIGPFYRTARSAYHSGRLSLRRIGIY